MARPLLLVFALAGLALSGCGKPAEKAADPVDPEEKLDRPVVKKDAKIGEGQEIADGDLVMVEFVGRIAATERIFERNNDRDDDGNGTTTPLSLSIGATSTLRGLSEGIRGMKKGGVRTITIPWQKAYGTAGNKESGILAKEDLIYEITLLDVVRFGDNETYDVEDVKAGGGPAAKEGDRVTIHYRGTYSNGLMFDDSHLRGDKENGGTPLSFRLGDGQVILGIDAGVRGMKAGGVRKLRIPPGLAYHKTGYDVIKGDQLLYFEVELLKVQP